MTTRPVVAVVAGVLVVASAALYVTRPGPATPTGAIKATSRSPAAAVDNPVEPDPAAQQNDAPSLAVGGDAAQTNTVYLPGHGPVEFEMMDGIRVRKDRNCTFRIVKYSTKPDGTVSPVYVCEPHEPRPADIYTTYSTEALKTLAYSDAHAAHVLSQRFREKDISQAIDYALRSSALADNTNSVRWLLNTYPTPTYKNGQVQVHVVEDNYVLSGVIYALGGPGGDHLHWSSLAQEHARDGIDREALDTRIARLMDTFESIRSEVGMD